MWFRNIVRMQKMQVELDLSRDTSTALGKKQSEYISEKMPNITKESMAMEATETELQPRSESQSDVHMQCSGLVII